MGAGWEESQLGRHGGSRQDPEVLFGFGGVSRVENRTVQRGCADSTVATVATHPVGEGGKRQRRLACYVHTVATA